MSDLVPRNKLSKQGVQGFVAVAGGIAVLILSGLGGLPGMLVGGALTVVGLALSGSKSDRKWGVATAIAGAAVLVSSIPFLGSVFGGFFHWVMRLGGIGLLGVGAVSLVRFFSNLKKRV